FLRKPQIRIHQTNYSVVIGIICEFDRKPKFVTPNLLGKNAHRPCLGVSNYSGRKKLLIGASALLLCAKN
ncbi:MAG: hypothetical protein D6677_01175, partial [Calditrichaeota bacterium]